MTPASSRNLMPMPFLSALVYSIVDAFHPERRHEFARKNATVRFVVHQILALSTQLRIPLLIACWSLEFGTLALRFSRFSRLPAETRAVWIRAIWSMKLPLAGDFIRLFASLALLAFNSAEVMEWED